MGVGTRPGAGSQTNAALFLPREGRGGGRASPRTLSTQSCGRPTGMGTELVLPPQVIKPGETRPNDRQKGQLNNLLQPRLAALPGGFSAVMAFPCGEDRVSEETPEGISRQ